MEKHQFIQRRRNKTKYNKKAKTTGLQDMDDPYGGKITVEIIKEQDLPYSQNKDKYTLKVQSSLKTKDLIFKTKKYLYFGKCTNGDKLN